VDKIAPSKPGIKQLGAAVNTYAAPGINSAASLAAQQGATKFVSSDAAGRLATTAYGPNDIARLDASVNNVANGLNTLGNAVAIGFANINQNMQSLERRAYQGVAVSGAMPTLHMPSAPGKTSVSARTGVYRGQAAFGAAFMHRLDTRLPIAVGGVVSVGVRNSAMVAGEVAAEF
jgi:autotransporter adhesin